MNPLDYLRSYQRQALTDLRKRWDAGATRVPMVLATGLGKTEIFSPLEGMWVGDKLTGGLFATYGLGPRVLVLAHTDELIDQAARKARQRNPDLTVGIVKAGVNQVHAQIIVSSRQTLASAKRREQIRNVGLIIVDECHHALRSNTYGKILEHFGAFNETCVNGHPLCRDCDYTPYVKVAGFTATFARGDKGKLSTVWEEVTFRRDILFGIRHGYLLDVSGQRVIVPDLDMSRVRQTAGDYRDGDIAEELERTFAPQIIAEKYAEVARGESGDLRQGIAFWPLVDTAYHGAEAFAKAGISSAVIHGGLPKEERRLILKKFQHGEITVVHNCMVLTEGFDAPWADVVVIARPTRSAPLYQQMVGRVLRPDLTVPAEQRGKALILDVTGAGANHDLRSLIDLSPERPLTPDDDGELSLLELEDMLLEQEAEEAAVGPVLPEETYAGVAEVVTFDPLHRDRVWSQTPGGTFFVSAGSEGYLFLAETVIGDPGQWDVVWCTKHRGSGSTAGLTEHQGLAIEEAMLWAEEEALNRGGHGTKSLTSRKSSWRSDVPTDAQLRMASGMGLNTDGLTKGELSEVMDRVIAARRIDPLVQAVKGARV